MPQVSYKIANTCYNWEKTIRNADLKNANMS